MALGPHVADHCPLPAEWVLGPGSSWFRPPPPGMALSGSTPAPSWEEDECLDYYGMLSLHRMFEVVGGQLTECELDLLAFLLDEAPGAAGGLSHTRSGLELLLELERRGQCDESDLRLLGQLLRVLARQDLLPHLARRRRRPGTVEWEGGRRPGTVEWEGGRLPTGRGPRSAPGPPGCLVWTGSYRQPVSRSTPPPPRETQEGGASSWNLAMSIMTFVATLWRLVSCQTQ